MKKALCFLNIREIMRGLKKRKIFSLRYKYVRYAHLGRE